MIPRSRVRNITFHPSVDRKKTSNSFRNFFQAIVLVILCCKLILVSSSNVNYTTNSTTNNTIFLTKDAYDTITYNRTVFIKWAASWCSHSQDMKPSWEKLVSTIQFENHSDLLIAEVDCSSAQQSEESWCIEMGYTAYPTLTYGDPSFNGIFLHTYQSLQKDYESLSSFVTQTLRKEKFCTAGNYNYSKHCTTEQKQKLQYYFDMSLQDLHTAIQDEETMIQQIRDEFQRKTNEMQGEYNKLSKDHESTKSKMKRKLKLYKELLRRQKQTQ